MNKNLPDLSLQGTLSRIVPKMFDENQKGCPYCKGIDDLNDTANSFFQLTIETLDENEPRIHINYDDGEYSTDDYSIAISYCPMCGRKLVDDEIS